MGIFSDLLLSPKLMGPQLFFFFLSLSLLSGDVPLEEEMAAHSSIAAWKIPWTEEPDGLQSMGSQKS